MEKNGEIVIILGTVYEDNAHRHPIYNLDLRHSDLFLSTMGTMFFHVEHPLVNQDPTTVSFFCLRLPFRLWTADIPELVRSRSVIGCETQSACLLVDGHGNLLPLPVSGWRRWRRWWCTGAGVFGAARVSVRDRGLLPIQPQRRVWVWVSMGYTSEPLMLVHIFPGGVSYSVIKYKRNLKLK